MKEVMGIYEKCYDELFEKAVEAYKETDVCKELNVKCLEVEERLKEQLSAEDYLLAIKETDVFVRNAESEGDFLYRQGFKDCIGLLKYFGII